MTDFIIQLLKENIYMDGNSIFTPIGNEEGLLILSSLNRNWLGSNKKVEVFPVRVILHGAEEGVHLIPEFPYEIEISSMKVTQ
jgi:hypothetical protein